VEGGERKSYECAVEREDGDTGGFRLLDSLIYRDGEGELEREREKRHLLTSFVSLIKEMKRHKRLFI
jgi:hypothetical protein